MGARVRCAIALELVLTFLILLCASMQDSDRWRQERRHSRKLGREGSSSFPVFLFRAIVVDEACCETAPQESSPILASHTGIRSRRLTTKDAAIKMMRS